MPLSLVEGRNPVLELLRHSPAAVRGIRIAQGLEEDTKIEQILQLSREHDIKVEKVGRHELDRASTTGHHQGVIALVKPAEYTPLGDILEERKKELCVILLADVQDPHNLGAILRTAEATGVDAVIIPKHRSVGLTATVHRTSMGGSTSVPVIRENLYPALKLLTGEGVRTVAVDPEGTVDYFEEKLTGSVALVIGGEDKGLNASLIERCDRTVRIPMKGKLTSLNVGVAVAVILYERMRQQREQKTLAH
jgi:23S rRNA (guanosine2251-2'-O)-methyltransferase